MGMKEGTRRSDVRCVVLNPIKQSLPNCLTAPTGLDWSGLVNRSARSSVSETNSERERGIGDSKWGGGVGSS